MYLKKTPLIFEKGVSFDVRGSLKMDDLMILEGKYLVKTIAAINSELKQRKMDLETLPKYHGGNPFLLETLMSIAATRQARLLAITDKPYFARIDFLADDKPNVKKCYIGKSGILDEKGDSVVIDWRSPICSLYYDSNLGRVSYQAPMGTIEGTLDLKRQFVIENKIIESIYDVDSVSDDELLKPYLKANADTRLKNIVSSIQKEQNQIIRATIFRNMIVEGVAGSGKTTVALHRIAYLVYNENERFKPSQFMVIGPNKFFINYISSVLPDLESGDVKQITLDGIAQDYINEKITFINHVPTLIDYISGKKDATFLKFKQSLIYKQLIDQFIDDWEKSMLSKDLIIDGIVIKRYILKDEYHRFSNIPIKDKIDHAIKGLKRKIDYTYPLIKTSEIEKKLKMYFKMPSRIITLYKTFVNSIDNYITDIDTTFLKSETLSHLNKNEATFEDMAALMYMKYCFYGSEKLNNYAHIVIDEAQDLGIFQFFILKKLFARATFTIFGDIAQAIYGYRSIESFDEVKQSIFNDNAESLKLVKSYRTTVEIMTIANKITSNLKLSTATPVIRHGCDVLVTSIEDKDEYISSTIKSWLQSGYKTIAVICKDDAECNNINKTLNKNDITCEIITYDKTQYNGGVCVLTSYLAKGLEFDCVIIYNASENVYSHDNIIDMKLLYVALTRALHELIVLYDNELTVYLI